MLGVKIAVSFNSSNIMITADTKGVLYNEPSLLVCDRYDNHIIAVGNEAKEIYDKIPESMYYENPLKNGIVSNFNNACILLKYYFDIICSGKLFKPSVIVALSSDISNLDIKTLNDALMTAGAAQVYFINKTLADALSFLNDIQKPRGFFICDIDGNNTESAVISVGDIVLSKSIDTGINDMSDSITEYIYHEYNIAIGAKQAENIRNVLSSAVMRNEEIALNVCGQSSETGLPVTREITSTELYWILIKKFEDIINCIKSVLLNCPPELAGDLTENGIYICGKGADIYGLDNFISHNTGLEVHIVNEPEISAIKGLRRIINEEKYIISHCIEICD